MKQRYSELLSTLGYEALDVIFEIESSQMSEREKRDLVSLIPIMEKDHHYRQKIQGIIEAEADGVIRKQKLLAIAKKR